MLNQIVVVGRLCREVEVKKSKGENQYGNDEKKYANVTLAIPRTYKNANGEYDTDFVDFILFDNIAENTAEYCKKGDIVGIKGSVNTYMKELEDGTKEKKTFLKAEKVTFLSSTKEKMPNEKEEDEDMEM